MLRRRVNLLMFRAKYSIRNWTIDLWFISNASKVAVIMEFLHWLSNNGFQLVINSNFSVVSILQPLTILMHLLQIIYYANNFNYKFMESYCKWASYKLIVNTNAGNANAINQLAISNYLGSTNAWWFILQWIILVDLKIYFGCF